MDRPEVPITITNLNQVFEQRMTWGERIADGVAAFGGSWKFIGIFVAAMAAWIVWNVRTQQPVDPFPFILLNLLLSCLAALQAPIIMMSQNRQAARDRLEAHQDFEVNVQAEAEVAELHAKIDRLEKLLLIALKQAGRDESGGEG
jgi:uncharacterized membrane protein